MSDFNVTSESVETHGFKHTLAAIDKLIGHLSCSICSKPNEDLRFIGTSCKHAFCWSCINSLGNTALILCPICALPVDPRHSSPVCFVKQLFDVLPSLKKNIMQLDTNNMRVAEILAAFEPDKPRTIEEFCATQQSFDADYEQTPSNADDLSNSAELSSANEHFGIAEPSSEAQSSRSDEMDMFPPCSPEIALFTQPVDESDDTGEVRMTQEPFLRNISPTMLYFKAPVPKKLSFSSSSSKETRVSKRANRSFVANSPKRSSFGFRNRCEVINAAIPGNKTRLIEALMNDEDANECDNLGFTALYHTAARNSIELCELLIEHGALINAHSGDLCETALHAAVRWKAKDVIKYLLKNGADWRALNLKGETAVDLATDDEVKALFDGLSDTSQIAYPFRSMKVYTVYLSTDLDERLLHEGKNFLEIQNGLASSLSTATHIVVSSHTTEVEINVDVMEAILCGLYVLSSNWLRNCLSTREIIDERDYEIRRLTSQGQLIAEGTCARARENAMKMKPRLFHGCHFYVCRHNFRPYLAENIKRLIQSGGGVLLGREPFAESYAQSGLRPFYAHEKQVTGLFAVYMPGQYIPSRIFGEQNIDLVTPMWLFDCIAKYELIKPEKR